MEKVLKTQFLPPILLLLFLFLFLIKKKPQASLQYILSPSVIYLLLLFLYIIYTRFISSNSIIRTSSSYRNPALHQDALRVWQRYSVLIQHV